MLKSKQLKYTNSRGESIIFNQIGSSFGLNNITGLGDVDADIQIQRSPYQDGASYIDSVLSTRAISFDVSIMGVDDTDISNKRSQLARVFNPKLGQGLLEYRYGDIFRVIDAVAEHVPSFGVGFENRGRRHQKALIDLICPDPYWRSTIIVEEPMAAFVEMFEFPSDYWELGSDGGLYFEMGTEGEKRRFTIKGDVEVPIQITFNGPSTNPVVINNTTGEFIKVNRTLLKGDVLFIDTDNATVEINGVDVFNWIDLNSTFWKLQVGENELEYTADAGVEEAKLTLKWQERYTAV